MIFAITESSFTYKHTLQCKHFVATSISPSTFVCSKVTFKYCFSFSASMSTKRWWCLKTVSFIPGTIEIRYCQAFLKILIVMKQVPQQDHEYFWSKKSMW